MGGVTFKRIIAIITWLIIKVIKLILVKVILLVILEA